MNRRGFLKGLLGAAVATVARLSPLVAVVEAVEVAPPLPETTWRKIDGSIFDAMNKAMADVLFYGPRTLSPPNARLPFADLSRQWDRPTFAQLSRRWDRAA